MTNSVQSILNDISSYKFYETRGLEGLSRDDAAYYNMNKFGHFDERQCRADAEFSNFFARSPSEVIDVEAEVRRVRLWWMTNKVMFFTRRGIFPPTVTIESVDSGIVEVMGQSDYEEFAFEVVKGKVPEVYEEFTVYKYAPGLSCLVDNTTKEVMVFCNRTLRVKRFSSGASLAPVELVSMSEHPSIVKFAGIFGGMSGLIDYIKELLRDIEKNPGPGDFVYYVTEKLRDDSQHTQLIHWMVLKPYKVESGDNVEFSQESLIRTYLDDFVAKQEALLTGDRVFCYSRTNKAEVTISVLNDGPNKNVDFVVSTNNLATKYGAIMGIPSLVSLDLDMPEKVSVIGGGHITVSIKFSFVSYPLKDIPDKKGFYQAKDVGCKNKRVGLRVYEVVPIENGAMCNHAQFLASMMNRLGAGFGKKKQDPRLAINIAPIPIGSSEKSSGGAPTMDFDLLSSQVADLIGKKKKRNRKKKQPMLEAPQNGPIGNNTTPKTSSKGDVGGGVKNVVAKTKRLSADGKSASAEIGPAEKRKNRVSKEWREKANPASSSDIGKGPGIQNKTANGDEKKKKNAKQPFKFSEFNTYLRVDYELDPSEIDMRMVRKVYDGKERFQTIEDAVLAYLKLCEIEPK